MPHASGAESRLDAALVLGLLIILGGAVAVLAFVAVPKDNQSLLAALLGAVVGGGLTAYVNYRWGSSRGSAAKDETIAALAKKDGP